MKKPSIFFLYKWGLKKSFIISFEGTYLTFNMIYILNLFSDIQVHFNLF